MTAVARCTLLAVALLGGALAHGQHAADAPFTVMTFNTGTGAPVTVAPAANLGYGPEQKRISDEYYGNGLAWKAAVEAVRAFVQSVSPDIVAFQEMFYSGNCEAVPEEARAGFVCENWKPGMPIVARIVLGEDYQIATHPGHNDKYLAVHKRFGRILGCADDFCPGGLEGHRIDGCGSGARVARAVIERTNGTRLTVISYHGTSGIARKDMAYRVRQVEQIFVDFGDGAPGANAEANLILGDFNTDPARMQRVDPSARRWNDFVGDHTPFHFISRLGTDTTGSYGRLNIDHIVSDAFDGEAAYPANTADPPPLFQLEMFDHTPVVATVQRRLGREKEKRE